MIPINQVYAQIARFASEAGAQKVILFGSRAKGTNRPKATLTWPLPDAPILTPLNNVSAPTN